MMHKILNKLSPKKKVEMRDVVSATPSKSAMRAVKNALQKSYIDQENIRTKASTIRSNSGDYTH
jgi:hypothetical protein